MRWTIARPTLYPHSPRAVQPLKDPEQFVSGRGEQVYRIADNGDGFDIAVR